VINLWTDVSEEFITSIFTIFRVASHLLSELVDIRDELKSVCLVSLVVRMFWYVGFLSWSFILSSFRRLLQVKQLFVSIVWIGQLYESVWIKLCNWRPPTRGWAWCSVKRYSLDNEWTVAGLSVPAYQQYPDTAPTMHLLFKVLCDTENRSRSHITTDGQSTSSSWCLTPLGADDQMLNLSEWQLLSLFFI
jgi:hypothetical protein